MSCLAEGDPPSNPRFKLFYAVLSLVRQISSTFSTPGSKSRPSLQRNTQRLHLHVLRGPSPEPPPDDGIRGDDEAPDREPRQIAQVAHE